MYKYEDGGQTIAPFPSAEGQIEIGAFRYDAKRMGGAPTITATVYYPSCLDDEWNWGVHVEFKGEKYYLKSTPTSSYSNVDARYVHTVELVSERKQLEDIYFYDAVVGVPQENDKPVTNDTSFHFYGNIADFVKRMNASLQYASLQTEKEDGTIEGYHVVIDEGITTADKHLSFDGAVFAQALQECYNTFAIPYYFVGKEIHVGFTNNAISDVLEYGVDDALLSVTRNNSNFKIVNRASGKGSSDNIPYYYPNNAPKGEIEAEVNTTSSDFEVSIADYEMFGEKIKIDDTIEYVNNIQVGYDTEDITWVKDFNFSSNKQTYSFLAHYGIKDVDRSRAKKLRIAPSLNLNFYKEMWFDEGDGETANTWYDWVEQPLTEVNAKIIISIDDNEVYNMPYSPQGLSSFEVLLDKKEEDVIKVKITFEVSQELIEGEGIFYYDNCLYKVQLGLTYNISFDEEVESRWIYNEKGVDLEDFGLSYKGTPNVGDTITQRLVKKVNTATNLQPSIYRATDGKERFYNATNYPFDYVDGYELQYGEYIAEGKVHNDLYKKDDGTYMVFVNPYVEGNPKEHVFSVDELKPTIEEMTNGVSWQDTDENGDTVNVYQRIDMFAEFAYDEGDNDETYTTEDGRTAYKHPYFFAKLRKLDFNLFEHASERQEMTFSMTSGNCGACNFLIGVSDDDLQLNPVQVDENGNLVRDEEGRVLCGLEDYQPLVQPQDEQQDTINNEVWIALKKEDSTYGILMPKAPKYDGDTLVEAGHRPRACSSATSNDGDTFVIIGINLPEEYILHAERKLEKKIIQYIGENNEEKFNFSIAFSRIYLEENPDILSQLNENARLTIRYNNAEYLLYVSSYSYNISEGDVLPEIRVELDDTLTIAQNALQRAIDSVKIEIGQKINALDVAGIGSRYFLRKDTTDVAEELIGFRKGVFFGDSSDVHVNPEDGTAKLTIDYLDVRRKATFTSLEIQEKTHVGGQFLITPAAMTCSYVEELEDAYRCYFQTAGEGGEEIFNTFATDDQAICQTYNAWGSKFYWRLVVGVGENYIDLSKTDCAPESDVPAIGDKIIQLGNRSNIARQAAQVLSSYGEDSPSFIMYNGIDSYSLEGKNITGIVWNPETQEPQMYSYGSFFFGDRELAGNYITFQKKDGDTEKSLHIKANVTIGADSSGLENLSEWEGKQEEINNAQAIANEAKDFTDALNSDTILTEVEKREIRRLLSEITECSGASVTEYNAKVERSTEQGNAWYLVNDNSYAEWYDEDSGEDVKMSQRDWVGYYSSNTHTNESETITRLSLTIHKPFDLKIKFGSDAESNYDFLNVGPLDTNVDPYSTEHDLEASAYQASTYGRQGIDNVMTKNFAIDGTSSSHFIELSYMKDSSESYNTDSGYYRLMNDSYMGADGNEYIVEMNGSFHKYYLTLMRNGYTAEATELKTRLNALMSFLDENGLWESENTTVDASFRATLNDYVAKYYAYAAEIGFGVSMDRINDTEYLTNAMKNGKTIINGGLVMSSMVAVADTESATDADVEAFLNGSDFAKDATYGKLILAGGIPESTESGSTDLVDRAKLAKTRIYEDGHVETNDIAATGGTFENVIVKGSARSPFTDGASFTAQYQDNYVNIGTGRKYSQLSNSISESGRRLTFVGCFGIMCTNGYIYDHGKAYYNQYMEIGNVGSDTNPVQYEVLTLIAVKTSSTTVAWVVENREPWGETPYSKVTYSGMFAGLRLKTRVITSTSSSQDRKLTEFDHTIIVNDWTGNAVSLELPSNPQDGQRYDIYTTNGGTNLNVSFVHDKTAYNFITGHDLSSPIAFTDGKRKHIEFFFCEQWWLNYRFLN